jgi:hypothetical protein
MTVPTFTQDQLFDFLKASGISDFNDKYWELGFVTITPQDSDSVTTLELRPSYNFVLVVKLCIALGVNAPSDHQKAYDQFMAMPRRKKK